MKVAIKPYLKYRDSGVDWLGRVPTHWEVMRSKRVFREVDDRGSDGTEPHLAMSQKYGLVPSADLATKHLRSASYAGAKRCLPGDIVLNRLKAHLGVFARANHRGVISPDYTVLRSEGDVEPRYFEYIYRSTAFRGELRKSVKGIVEGFWRLYSADLGRLMVPVPAPEEQRRIADFLDAYTAQVHRLIAAKRRLLKAVHEQNQLALHELLVRGADRDAPLVSSGHPWLGEVPQGWEVAPLKQFAAVNPPLGRTLPATIENVAFLPMERIGVDASVDYTERRQVQAVASGFTSFVSGDIVLAKITPCFENGKSAWLNEMPTEIGFGTTELHVVRPTSRVRPELLLSWLRLDLFREWGAVSMVGAAGQQRVPPRFVRNFVIAVSPSADEQARMVTEARRLNEDHRSMSARIRREIELILEYRDSLIAAVVTGQLDVRKATIPVVECDDLADDAASDEEDMEDMLDAVD